MTCSQFNPQKQSLVKFVLKYIFCFFQEYVFENVIVYFCPGPTGSSCVWQCEWLSCVMCIAPYSRMSFTSLLRAICMEGHVFVYCVSAVRKRPINSLTHSLTCILYIQYFQIHYFFTENCRSLIQFSLRFVPSVSINYTSIGLDNVLALIGHKTII